MSDNTATSSYGGSTPPPLSSREKQRYHEMMSRQRRRNNLGNMRQQAEALECAVSALSFISEPDAVWDEFLAPEDKRVRDYLRSSVKLLGDEKQLKLEHDQLKKLLTNYEDAKRVVTQLLQDVNRDDWNWNVQRWRAFTLLYFENWTMEECQAEIDAGLRDMNNFIYGKGDRVSTGVSFLGWRDQRRFDGDINALQFSLYKTFRGHDMLRHMDLYWTCYHTPEMYKRLILGRGVMSMDVLQKIAPHISIIRYVERYAGVDINVHCLYLISRVETERGFTQYLRSIPCPDLQRATNAATDVWASNFFWFRWEILGAATDLTHTDYRVTVGGTLAGDNADYGSRWMGEVLCATIRGEQAATGRSLLKMDW